MDDRHLNKFSLNTYTPRLKATEKNVDLAIFSRIFLADNVWKMEFGPVEDSDLFLINYTFLLTSSEQNVIPIVLMLVTENGFSNFTEIKPVMSLHENNTHRHWFNGIQLVQPTANKQDSFQVKFLVTGTSRGTVEMQDTVSNIHIISSRVLPALHYPRYRKIMLTV
ncbi:hypothetical protein ECIV_ORF86 [European chub iridovirus]|nr:hypothetical protein ECIV_ORF86 [European chub iridovirus]